MKNVKSLLLLYSLGILLIAFGVLLLIKPTGLSNQYTGYFITSKDFSFGIGLLIVGILLIIFVVFVVDIEVERIKKHMEERHGKKFPEIDVVYSDKAERGQTIYPISYIRRLSYLFSPSRYREDRERFKRYEEALGVKVSRSKYTIVLPSNKSIERIIEEYSKGKSPEEVKRIHEFHRKFTPMYNYAAKWEEMGHILALINDIGPRYHRWVNEGIAELYHIKGLLLAVKEGIFPAEDVWTHIDAMIKEWRKGGLPIPSRHGRDIYSAGFYTMVHGIVKDFDPKKGLPIDETIKKIDERVNWALEFYGKLYPLKEKFFDKD